MTATTDAMRTLAAGTIDLVAALRAQIGSGSIGTDDQRAQLAGFEATCAALAALGGTAAVATGLNRLATAYVGVDALLNGEGPAPTPGSGGKLDGSDPAQSGVTTLFL